MINLLYEKHILNNITIVKILKIIQLNITKLNFPVYVTISFNKYIKITELPQSNNFYLYLQIIFINSLNKL